MLVCVFAEPVITTTNFNKIPGCDRHHTSKKTKSNSAYKFVLNRYVEKAFCSNRGDRIIFLSISLILNHRTFFLQSKKRYKHNNN